MQGFLEPFKNWFGYDRKERRASLVLLILILFVLVIRMTYPRNKTEIIDLTPEYKPLLTTDDDSLVKERKARIESHSKGYSTQNQNIELNSCDSMSLESLPGIGPVLSARIIKYRKLLGGFVSVDQLKEVYGLSWETFERIKGKIEVDPSGTRKININTADYKELTLLPYLKRFHLVAVIKYREIRDSIVSIEELVENKIIPDSVAVKVRAYIVF